MSPVNPPVVLCLLGAQKYLQCIFGWEISFFFLFLNSLIWSHVLGGFAQLLNIFSFFVGNTMGLTASLLASPSQTVWTQITPNLLLCLIGVRDVFTGISIQHAQKGGHWQVKSYMGLAARKPVFGVSNSAKY